MSDASRSAVILNVDADEAGRYAVTRLLQRAGFIVTEAGAAQQALELAMRMSFDLILLDVHLPDMDGLEVARRLKGVPETAATAIILLTATALDEDTMIAGLESGADAYVTEPVAPEVLLAQVNALLRVGQAHRQAARARAEAEAHAQQLGVVLEELHVANEELESANEEMQVSHDELEQQQALLQSIIDGSPDIVFVKDRDGRFLTINAQLEKLLGRSREEVRGKTDYDLFPREAAEYNREHDWRVLEAGAPQQTEEVLELADGRHILLTSKFPLRNGKGEVYAVCGISTDITERVRMETAVRRQAELLDLSHEAIFTWELGGAIVSWNRGAEELYGYTREEAIGQGSHDLLKTEHPQGAPRLVAGLEANKVWGGELIHTTKDGRRITVEARLQVIEEASGRRIVLESNRDVTARKRVEEALRVSEEQFRRAIEEAPIPVIMHAEDGEVLQISRSWTELTGYTLADAPTFDSWLTRAYGEGADAVRAHVRTLFSGDQRTIDLEFPVRTRNGQLRRWSFSASSPGALRDGRRFVVGMAVDVTDRRKAEEALLAAERARAELAEHLNDEIAHRVKNNLAMISGLLQMQAIRQGDPQLSSALRDSVARVRTFASIHEQMYGGQSGQVDVLEAVHKIAQTNQEVFAASGGVEISTQGTPVWCHSRFATNLSVIANELITNALKHGMPIDGAKQRVEVRVAEVDGQLVLEVWSSGNPVSEDFDPTQQVGMGLLLVTDLVVNQYHGDFLLRPERGGTLARVALSRDEFSPA